jgi:hypothetical protein
MPIIIRYNTKINAYGPINTMLFLFQFRAGSYFIFELGGSVNLHHTVLAFDPAVNSAQTPLAVDNYTDRNRLRRRIRTFQNNLLGRKLRPGHHGWKNCSMLSVVRYSGVACF